MLIKQTLSLTSNPVLLLLTVYGYVIGVIVEEITGSDETASR